MSECTYQCECARVRVTYVCVCYANKLGEVQPNRVGVCGAAGRSQGGEGRRINSKILLEEALN